MSRYSSVFRCVLAVFTMWAGFAEAQDSARITAAPVGRDLRVFFDCNADCDNNYVRTETPWISFVRDRTDADVHLLITSLGTGAGGEKYTLNFVGLGQFAGRNDTLTFDVLATDTEDVGRRGLTRTIQLGLGPFVARTPVGLRLRMELDEDDDERRSSTAGVDPWRAWVFELDGNGSIEKEARQEQFEWGGSFDARRITSQWKFGFSANAEFNESRFRLDEEDGGQEVVSIRENYNGGAVIIRSHGLHWGSGFQVTASSSTFSNTRSAFRAAPAVEYSVFPYTEFTRRQLTVQYSVGLSAYKYRELTIFGLLEETRPTHALVVGYDVSQPWGSADVTFETARYLDDPSQWRLEVDGEIDIRLTRGLSLELGGSRSVLRDQLSIAARDATPEEILLELRDLQTNFQYDLRIGLSYTFGSLFSSVVNPRFGTGPGNIMGGGGGGGGGGN